MVILDSKYNRGMTFEQYYNIQLEFHRFEAIKIYYHHRTGLPENGWYMYPDLENVSPLISDI